MRTTRTMPALLAAALALLLLPTGGAGGVRCAAHFATADEDELVEQARRALARMPSAERLGEVRDARVRRAVQTAYAAVAEIADNREPGRAARLNAKFERAYAAVVRASARSEHKTCARNCEADGQTCQTECKAAGKKSCGCRLATFACFVAECVL